jgi:hypothetical protein
MRKIALAFAAIAFLSITAPAQAAITTTNYSISGGTSGTFSLGFDDSTSLYSLAALDVTVGSTTFNTSNAGLFQFISNVTIGGNPSGVQSVSSTDDDFVFTLTAGPQSQTSTFFYHVAGGLPSPLATSVTISQIPTTAPVPEPSTWAMMLLGFSVVGFAFRRRRQATATAPQTA